MLQANPTLGYRDVVEIPAYYAKISNSRQPMGCQPPSWPLAAVGYVGTSAVTGGWLALFQDASGTGTNIATDTHDGRGLQLVIDVVGMPSTALREGVDFWTT